MKKAGFSLFLFIFLLPLAHAQQAGSLLFHLSAERGATADFARGDANPNFLANVSPIPDGARGKALHCGYRQLLAWKAPGNIYASEGTLAFYWRSAEPFTPTEFPIFRVSFADHTSWDMTWLRIDYNGHGFDAFVTDNNLVRVRVSTTVDPLPAPDKWTHFALSWDETRGIRFYINGREAARRDTTVTLNTGLDQFGPHSRIISPYQVQSAYNMQRGGDIDELVIYGKMLTESEIAQLARGGAPAVKAPQGQLADAATEQAWRRFYGFDGAAPPVLEAEHTAVRKLGILDIYDVKRWFWKAGDGIRETTWPGVYNRSRIEGRNDYFQLPDWDCYSTSGQQVRFLLPDEPWNYVEVTGGAYGSLGVSADAEGTAPEALARKERGTQRSFHRLAAERRGGTLVFTNDVQETPIQELNTYYVHEGDAPQGIARLSYTLADFDARNHPQLTDIQEFVAGRYRPGERRMLLAQPAQARQYDNPMDYDAPQTAVPGWQGGKPIVHIVIPSDVRDLDLGVPKTLDTAPQQFGEFGSSWRSNVRSYSWIKLQGGLDGIRVQLPALPASLARQDGLIPLNIAVKDPVWPLRDLLDFSFSVRPGEARTLWLDLRDRILPDDKPLYLTLAWAGPDFDTNLLKKMRIELVFKDYKSAKAEHTADRFTQVRDTYAMLCEENTTSRRLSKYRQIEADMNDLLKVDPDHRIGRKYWHIYNSEQPLPYTEPVAPKGMPEWAFLQLELLRKYREVFEWFIDKRQIEGGEFGGGISDDTDLTNHFPGLVHLGVAPEKFAESLHRFMEAVYAEGTLTNGMSTIMTDGLHTYEEGTNTVVQVNTTEYGNPLQVERLMESARSVRDHLLGTTPNGHLHFRSDYFSATRIAESEPWTWSSYREYYHTGPGLLLGDAYGNPAAREYLLRLAESTLAHARTDDRGRIQLPNEINFLTDEARSWGERFAVPLMWYAWRWTGDARFLRAVEGTGWDHKDFTPETLSEQIRRDLRAIDAREFIMTEGSLWIDRISFPCETIQQSRLGGVAMTRSQNLVPSNPVRWHFARPDDAQRLAILVTHPDPGLLEIEFFNTARRAMKVRLEGVEAPGGTWTLTLPGGRTKTVEFGRARSVELRIPRKGSRIRLELASPAEDYALRPDAGVGPEDLEPTSGGLAVTVHNLGGVDLPGVTVALTDRRGRILSQTETPAIPAPSDLVPKTARVVLEVPRGCDLEACSVVLNPGRENEEIYPGNNITSFRHRASQERPE
ncbi:MAG: LamG domain-containing protein [Bacteroidales bacterium]|nr:LamG domain-containing protein [Bacteroidales bacterium]